MATTNTKTPQVISALISEIGERMVLFKLYALTHNIKHLEVFKNYSEAGYDIGIRNCTTGEKVKIEVKTRQHLISTGNSLNSCHFTLTENEYNHAHFLVGYWIDHNDFFIIPKEKLSRIKSGEKHVYKHIASICRKPNTGQKYTDSSKDYYNNWERLIDFIK